MPRFFMHILPFEKYDITTRLTQEEIFKRIACECDDKNSDYIALFSENKFVFAEKTIKRRTVGHVKNSFAPVAVARLIKENDMTRVSVKARMPIFSCAVFLPIHAVFALCFVCGLISLAFDIAGLFFGIQMTGEFLSLLLFFPIDCIFMYFAFKRPAKRLRETLEAALTRD